MYYWSCATANASRDSNPIPRLGSVTLVHNAAIKMQAVRTRLLSNNTSYPVLFILLLIVTLIWYFNNYIYFLVCFPAIEIDKPKSCQPLLSVRINNTMGNSQTLIRTRDRNECHKLSPAVLLELANSKLKRVSWRRRPFSVQIEEYLQFYSHQKLPLFVCNGLSLIFFIN